MRSLKNLILGDRRQSDADIVEIFGTNATDRSEALSYATDWARKVLADANVPAEKQVAAIAELRRAEPRLGLKAATELADRLRERP